MRQILACTRNGGNAFRETPLTCVRKKRRNKMTTIRSVCIAVKNTKRTILQFEAKNNQNQWPDIGKTFFIKI